MEGGLRERGVFFWEGQLWRDLKAFIFIEMGFWGIYGGWAGLLLAYD